MIVEDAEWVTMAPASSAESMLLRDGWIAVIGPAAAVSAAAEPGAAVVRLDAVAVRGAGQRGPLNVFELATGASLQALLQNDGERLDLAQGSPAHACLRADALRVLAGAPVPVAASAVEAPLPS